MAMRAAKAIIHQPPELPSLICEAATTATRIAAITGGPAVVAGTACQRGPSVRDLPCNEEASNGEQANGA